MGERRSPSPDAGNEFRPIFIVGVPRSGTTLLAVLLDRHSRIAVPPETQFFSEFVPRHWAASAPRGRAGLLEAALGFDRIADLGLDFDEVLQRYRELEATPAGLLRALLEAYAVARGVDRPGEKTPDHLEHVATLLSSYPEAKVIAIVRDGRDVVLSLQATPWARADSPRRFWLFCLKWSDAASRVMELRREWEPERFRVVKYEALLQDPEGQLRKISELIGEEFETTLLDPASQTQAVPTWEAEWKDKARGALDPSRVGAWRREASQEQIWAMNSMMGRALRELGYGQTELSGCPLWRRFALALFGAMHWPLLRRAAVTCLRALRRLRAA